MFAKEDKSHRKIRDHCDYTGKYRDAAHSIFNLRFNVPDKVPVVFHNFSNCGYHFIIIELANDFHGQFECLGEITEKYKTFFIPIDGTENIVTISYKIKFIDSAKFMTSSLSIFVNNLAERIHKIRCKYCDCFLNMKVSIAI